MQYFKTASGDVFAYEDNVTIVTAADGTTTGTIPSTDAPTVTLNKDGTKTTTPPAPAAFPNVPTDLKPYTPPAPTAADKLAEAQAAQIGQVTAEYKAAISADIVYNSVAGVKQTYQADAGSRSNLQDMLEAFRKPQAVPNGFFWVSLDNTHVDFTYADLQGLAETLGTRGAAAFVNLQVKKSQIRAATTIADVQAVT